MAARVSIEGLEKHMVLLALFRNSLQYGAGMVPSTEEIMSAIDFTGDDFDPTPYDGVHYEGYAAKVVARYRETGLAVRYFTL